MKTYEKQLGDCEGVYKQQNFTFQMENVTEKKRMGRKSEKKDVKSCSRASPNGFYSLARIQLSQNVETFYSFNFKMRYEWKIKSFVRDFR